MTENKQLISLYISYTGHTPLRIDKLSSAGSNRVYFRFTGQPSLIGVQGESVAENKAFIYLAQHFLAEGLPVPQVYAVSDDGLYYLQEDLGELSLFDAIFQGRQTGNFTQDEIACLKQTIRWLPEFQCKAAKTLDFSQCYPPQAAFDRRSIFWDLNYFKYCFLKTKISCFDEDELERDFEHLAKVLLDCPTDGFMYRDFQSRNVMLKDQHPFFIDFQSGRKGPVFYDIASFLWQAKANYPEALRQELLDIYLEALRPYHTVDKTLFCAQLRHFVLFRTLQVLGAYGFRGYFERKPHFLQSIPFALKNLQELLQTPFSEYPYLSQLLSQLDMHENLTFVPKSNGLTVYVYSFAYKKGIPEDLSGNGGGFVFDCRAMHNPGRYECYQSLTGRDQPVIDFLETYGEVFTFMDHVYALIDASVQRYLKRGFTSLQVSFGCTGGQHRSVYCAQTLAEYLSKRYDIRVVLQHREQQITQIFSSKHSDQ